VLSMRVVTLRYPARAISNLPVAEVSIRRHRREQKEARRCGTIVPRRAAP